MPTQLIFIGDAPVRSRPADDVGHRAIERPGRPGDRIEHALLGRAIGAKFPVKGFIPHDVGTDAGDVLR